MKKYIFAAVAFAAFMFVAPSSAMACSCMVTDDPPAKQVQNAYGEATAVLAGEVISVTDSADDSYSRKVTIKVAKSWKGGSAKEITITTGKDSAMCGFNFEVGTSYLIYAHGDAAKLSTTICTRTAEFKADGDAKHLDKLKKKRKVKKAKRA